MFTSFFAVLGALKDWKVILKYGLPLVVVVGGLWYAYSWAVERGETKQMAKDGTTITKLTDARDKAVKERTAYKDSYDLWKAQSLAEAVKAKQAQQVLVERLTSQLLAEQAKAPTIKVITKEVVKYVTPDQDARTPISLGFVQLYNNAIHGTTGQAGFSGGPGTTVDTPSGLKLSAVSSVLVYNTAVCLQYKAQLVGWQRWYHESKAIFEQAQLTPAPEE